MTANLARLAQLIAVLLSACDIVQPPPVDTDPAISEKQIASCDLVCQPCPPGYVDHFVCSDGVPWGCARWLSACGTTGAGGPVWFTDPLVLYDCACIGDEGQWTCEIEAERRRPAQ